MSAGPGQTENDRLQAQITGCWGSADESFEVKDDGLKVSFSKDVTLNVPLKRPHVRITAYNWEVLFHSLNTRRRRKTGDNLDII